MRFRFSQLASGLGLSILTLDGGVGSKAALPVAEARTATVAAISTEKFLDSIGINTHVDQGYDPNSYVAPLRFMGIRQVRDGARNIPSDVLIHKRAGVKFDIFADVDINSLVTAAKALAASDALLSVEGPNEPNNFPITYRGEKGGSTGSWKPVLDLQKALYEAVKADNTLKRFPVFGVSETGAETDNVGLQFLTDPRHPQSSPSTIADFVNVHNYVSGNGNLYGDNQAWNASDPTLNARWDGLYGNHGVTWRSHFEGYSIKQLDDLPRVTTETGWDSKVDAGGEKTQGAVLTNTYLAQFKRGWTYTFVYELRDGEGGNGNQGLYEGTRPKLAATYLHNMTTLLSGGKQIEQSGSLNYTILNAQRTVHDLLLQKQDGVFDLIVWDERTNGQDAVTISLGKSQNVVNVYDVEAGTSPIQTLKSTDSVNLNLSDHAVIIELRND